jgi:DNA-directed RNA polymerase specialized sigma24 family protein
MRRAYPDLARHGSIAEVLEHQQGSRKASADRYRMIRVLVSASQAEAGFRSVAQIMVLVALWPGLDAVLGRLARDFPGERADLPTEIVARLSEGIATLDLGAVTAVTATLIRNTERDIRRHLVARQNLGRRTLDISDPAVESAVSVGSEDAADGRDLCADLTAGLCERDAHLLRRIFVLGETQEQAGSALGLGAAASRKRFQRAAKRLQAAQEKSCPALSHSDLSIGL